MQYFEKSMSHLGLTNFTGVLLITKTSISASFMKRTNFSYA